MVGGASLPRSYIQNDRIVVSTVDDEDEASVSENAPVIETVEIPGEPRPSNPVPPPITVQLPIVVWPHEFKNSLFGLVFLPAGLLMLLTAGLIAFGFEKTVLDAHDIHPSLRGVVVFLILLFVFPWALFYGMGLTGAALTCFWDAVRNDPVLEITAVGLRDYRSGLAVPWSSVRSAKPIHGAFAIDLQFRGPVKNWQNPFRVGVLFQRRRPPDHVIVSVAHLHTPAHILAYTILTLVQSNGGEVVSKLPSGLEMYPRLLPRRAPAMINRPASLL
jgi:hypothetical protein